MWPERERERANSSLTCTTHLQLMFRHHYESGDHPNCIASQIDKRCALRGETANITFKWMYKKLRHASSKASHEGDGEAYEQRHAMSHQLGKIHNSFFFIWCWWLHCEDASFNAMPCTPFSFFLFLRYFFKYFLLINYLKRVFIFNFQLIPHFIYLTSLIFKK